MDTEEVETLCAWVQDNWDEPDWKETYSWQERAMLIAEAVQSASGKQSVDVTTHVRQSVINAIMRSDRLQCIIET
jgi:hypothetical protein